VHAILLNKRYILSKEIRMKWKNLKLHAGVEHMPLAWHPNARGTSLKVC